jgi:gliding motility-associated-like protein
VCADTAQVTYSLYPQPQPSFVAPGPSCGPLDTVLTALGSFGPTATYSWNLGAGATPPTATGQQVGVVFGPNGPHSVTLTVQENGCTGSFTATVATSPQPEAFFTSDLTSPQSAGANVVFTDQTVSNGAAITSTTWTLDGGVVATGSGWTWENAMPGTHTITLTVVTAEGCTSSYSMSFTIIPEDIIIPNVFTPNNDGLNDAFVIENVQYYDNTLTIYNRWGQAVFEATNYRNNWRALDLPDGTYYYVLHLADGRDFAGHVTLLR